MMTSPAEFAEWGSDQLFGPGVDSTNRVYALLECLEEAPGREHMWRLLNMGWGACDAVPADVVKELLAIMTAGQPFGTEFLEGEDREFFDSLPEAVEIFRGCTPSRQKGMAWSTDMGVAKGFAHGHRGIRVPDGTVYRTMIPKDEILTVCMDREECEVLVDPSKLQAITVAHALTR